MKHNLIFTSLGGSGSLYLMDVLERMGITVHKRPDMCWCPQIVAGWRKSRYSRMPQWERRYQLLTKKGLRALPKQHTMESFHHRTGHVIDRHSDIETNLKQYVQYMRAMNIAVLFGRVGLAGFFSRNKIREVTFVIRHPLHAYVSLLIHRHPEIGRGHGGVESADAVSWYAGMWNALIDEYAACRSEKLNPHLVRFESAHADVAAMNDSFMKRLFRGFDVTKRNHGELSSVRVAQLKSLVSDRYNLVYHGWEI